MRILSFFIIALFVFLPYVDAKEQVLQKQSSKEKMEFVKKRIEERKKQLLKKKQISLTWSTQKNINDEYEVHKVIIKDTFKWDYIYEYSVKKQIAQAHTGLSRDPIVGTWIIRLDDTLGNLIDSSDQSFWLYNYTKEEVEDFVKRDTSDVVKQTSWLSNDFFQVDKLLSGIYSIRWIYIYRYSIISQSWANVAWFILYNSTDKKVDYFRINMAFINNAKEYLRNKSWNWLFSKEYNTQLRPKEYKTYIFNLPNEEINVDLVSRISDIKISKLHFIGEDTIDISKYPNIRFFH